MRAAPRIKNRVRETHMGKTAVFDLDGTLVDTAYDLVSAMNAIAGRFDLPQLDHTEARLVAGRGGRARS